MTYRSGTVLAIDPLAAAIATALEPLGEGVLAMKTFHIRLLNAPWHGDRVLKSAGSFIDGAGSV